MCHHILKNYRGKIILFVATINIFNVAIYIFFYKIYY
jgi:hypothetical protein